MSDAPILYTCIEDGVMVPASPFWQRKAAEHYRAGARYELVEHQERSDNSHRHFFATIREAFQNLPDALLDEYPTADRLRRKLLIKGGFCKEQTVECATKAEAQRWADITRQREPDSIVIARGVLVRIFTAESMSYRTMDRKRFQAAKEFILGELSSMLGSTPRELERTEAA